MGERGEISLTGLLVAMTIFIAVLGATLTTFDAFNSQAQEVTRRTDAQDTARRASDAIARELRNLASPVPERPQAVDVAGPTDLVFQTVDAVRPSTTLNAPNVKRVRYCLNAGERKLYRQEQTWRVAATPAVPSTSGCPAAATSGGWGGGVTQASNISNGTRRTFTYDAALLSSITSIGVELWVDDTPGKAPPETLLTTGVFLRNQNRVPLASFTATPTPQGVVLNGSASTDPEGQTLEYVWYDGAQKVGSGVTFLYVPGGPVAARSISLRVYDPGNLEGVAPARTVTA